MDEDLRDLERAAARGEPDARRALLVARRRAGRLDDERLAYAAALGDPDARALLGESAPARLGLVAWLEAVRHEPWGPSAYLAAAIAAARAVLPVFEARHPEDRGPRRCVEAAERVLERPSAERRSQAKLVAEPQARAHIERMRRTAPGRPLPAHTRAAFVALTAASAAAYAPGEEQLRILSCSQAVTEAFEVAPPEVDLAARLALCRRLLE